MKVRLFSLLVIALAILGAMALTAGSANADGGPHSQRTSLTNVTNCADCHRAHDAQATTLVADSSVYALCTTCHGPGGETAEDVVDGWYNSATSGVQGPLKGGGFANATMNVGWSSTAPTQTVTQSQHDVVGFGSYTSDTVWGFGAISSTPNPGMANFALQCSTCHDPHGGSGIGTQGGTGGIQIRQKTYRILRSDLGSKLGASTTSVAISDTLSHKYTITSLVTDTVPYKYYGQTYPQFNDTTGTDNNLALQLDNWCASCHQRIHATSNLSPEYNSSGDAIYTFRHRTDGNGIDFNFDPSKSPVNKPTNAPGCMTCHVVHGSTASIAYAYGTTEPLIDYPGTTIGADGLLFRLNGVGVCETCHNK